MLQLTDATGPRFQLALERLEEGQAFSLNGVSFWIAPDSHLYISVASSWEYENLTDDRALTDLERAQRIYKTLCVESPEFAAIAHDHFPRFLLFYDCGNGSVELAHLFEGKLIWANGLKPPLQ